MNWIFSFLYPPNQWEVSNTKLNNQGNTPTNRYCSLCFLSMNGTCAPLNTITIYPSATCCRPTLIYPFLLTIRIKPRCKGLGFRSRILSRNYCGRQAASLPIWRRLSPQVLVFSYIVNRDKEGHTFFVFRNYCSPKSFSCVPAGCVIKANFVKPKCYFFSQVKLGIELLAVLNRGPFLC